MGKALRASQSIGHPQYASGHAKLQVLADMWKSQIGHRCSPLEMISPTVCFVLVKYVRSEVCAQSSNMREEASAQCRAAVALTDGALSRRVPLLQMRWSYFVDCSRVIAALNVVARPTDFFGTSWTSASSAEPADDGTIVRFAALITKRAPLQQTKVRSEMTIAVASEMVCLAFTSCRLPHNVS